MTPEARRLNEVDRARQSIKDRSREHDRQDKELRSQISQLQRQRDELKQDLQASRAELRTATTTRTGLEKRLKALTRIPAKARRTAKLKLPVQRKQDSKNRRTAKSVPAAHDRVTANLADRRALFLQWTNFETRQSATQ